MYICIGKTQNFIQAVSLMPAHETMETVTSEVKVCRKCPLWKKRQNAVPGEGNIKTPVLFIGEAPGYWEDVRGRPFVGAAGKLLDEMLSNIELLRADVYVTNIVKCRPPGNRDPRPLEINTCTPYLNRQIRIIKPQFVVTLGRHASSYVFHKAGAEVAAITRMRGRVYDLNILGFKIRVIPMLHPAAALYNAKYKRFLTEDFDRLRGLLGESTLLRE